MGPFSQGEGRTEVGRCGAQSRAGKSGLCRTETLVHQISGSSMCRHRLLTTVLCLPGSSQVPGKQDVSVRSCPHLFQPPLYLSINYCGVVMPTSHRAVYLWMAQEAFVGRINQSTHEWITALILCKLCTSWNVSFLNKWASAHKLLICTLCLSHSVVSNPLGPHGL